MISLPFPPPTPLLDLLDPVPRAPRPKERLPVIDHLSPDPIAPPFDLAGDSGGEQPPYLGAVLFRLPADLLWPWLSDPLRFPRLYPSWVARVERLGPGFYVATGPSGARFALRPRLCQASGVVDVEIVAPGAMVEVARGRIFPVPAGCLFVRVTNRWAGEDDAAWNERRRATTTDLERAARELEQELAARAA